MNAEEIQNKLEELAFERTKPFCYSCYQDCQNGHCKDCGSDDLMRHLKSVGVEYDTDWVIKNVIEEELSEVDVEESFEQMIEELYGEEIQKDCSSTISLENSFSKKMDQLNEMRKKHAIEKKEIDKNLAIEKAKNKNLKNEVSNLKQYILQNKNLFSQVNALKDDISTVRNRINLEQEKVTSAALTGARINEISKIIGSKIHTSINTQTACYRNFNTMTISRHGNTLLCWDGNFSQQTLLGYCQKDKCWTRG